MTRSSAHHLETTDRTTRADVLVIDAGGGRSRSPLATVRALGAAGHRVLLATWSPSSLAASSRFCSDVIGIPPDTSDAFAAGIGELVRERGPVATFACSDRALVALGGPAASLVDKSQLQTRGAAVGLPVPSSTRCESRDEVRDALSAIGTAVVAKPVVSTYAAVRLERDADVDRLGVGPDAPVLVQRFLEGPLTAISAVVADGHAIAAVQQVARRTWPPQCGVACAATTVDVDEALAARLAELVSPYQGIVQAQLVDGHLIDLNPRPYGSMPLALRAGVNLPAVWCDVVAGRRVDRVRGRPGVHYRWIDADVRWIASALWHRRPAGIAAALIPRRGTAHSVWSISDPRPAWTRVRSHRAAR